MSRAYRNYLLSFYEEKRARQLQRAEVRELTDPFELPEEEFLENYKVSQEMVQYICTELEEDLTPSSSTGLAVVFKVLSSLKILMTGHYQRSTGNEHMISISQTTMSKYFSQFLDSAYSRLTPQWIKFPGTEYEREQVAAGYQRRFGLPNILGSIDCTHVDLFPPPKPTQAQYLNRHGNTSINVQLVADAECRILNCNANFPGRTHDQFIFNQSCVKEEMRRLFERRIGQYYLLGDSGYALEPWLITPIRDAEHDTAEKRFTDWHCQTRNVIERTNGYLKGTFRCLGVDRSIHYAPEKASKIIYVSCTMYNIMKHFRLPLEHIDCPSESNDPAEYEPNARLLNTASLKRNQIIREYFS